MTAMARRMAQMVLVKGESDPIGVGGSGGVSGPQK